MGRMKWREKVMLLVFAFVALMWAPPFLAAALLAYFSNLSAGLTHYGADARSDLFRRRLRLATEVAPVGIDRFRVEYSDLGFGGAGLVEDSGIVVSCDSWLAGG
jgi:hypothetical protein